MAVSVSLLGMGCAGLFRGVPGESEYVSVAGDLLSRCSMKRFDCVLCRVWQRQFGSGVSLFYDVGRCGGEPGVTVWVSVSRFCVSYCMVHLV